MQELKSLLNRVCSVRIAGINRTMQELKSNVAAMGYNVAAGINRTMQELKSVRQQGAELNAPWY